MAEAVPTRSRPIPYWDTGAEAPLGWDWALERIEAARNYWVVLKRKGGRAYSRPVWGVWIEGAFHFDSGSMGGNLEGGAEVEVHLESGDEVVILQGRAERVTDPGRLNAMAERINAKYAWDWKPDGFPAPYSVRPSKAFGWRSDPSGRDGGALFGQTGTRWTFPA